MNRLPIYIEDDDKLGLGTEDEWEFSREQYNAFIHILKETGSYPDFGKSISLVCDICGSYILDTGSLYRIVSDIYDLSPFSDNEMVDWIYHETLVPVLLTEQEWIRYLGGTITLKSIRPRVDLIREEWAYRYKAEEYAFIFDRECSCYAVMAADRSL
jgi:hypothetical protein